MSPELNAVPDHEARPAAEAVPTNALRRRLMFGLPGSLALAGPLALWGCSGGGDGADAAPPAAADDPAVTARIAALNARVAANARTVQRVSVQLPAAAAPALLAGARLMTAHNQAEVAADGSSAAVLLGGGAQMACLTNAAGELLLMGLVDTGANERIDARSTAEALILAASDVTVHHPALQLALRKTLRSHALVEPVRAAVEAALARGPLSETDTALVQAVDAALRVLRPPAPAAAAAAAADGRAYRRSARVWQAGGGDSAATARSGVWIEPTADYNTVQAVNRFRRRAHVWVDRLSNRRADGSTVDSPKRLVDFELKPTTSASFDSLTIAVADFYAKLASDIGFIGPYEADPTVWTPVSAPPLMLPVEPSPAVASIYTARVVGPGSQPGGALSAEEETKLQELILTTWLEDLYTPFMKNIVAPWLTDFIVAGNPAVFESMTKELLAWFISDLTSSTVGRQFFPNTWAALQNGDLVGAAVSLGSEFFNSSTFQVLLHRSLAALSKAYPQVTPIATGSGGSIRVNLNPGSPLQAADFSKAMTKFARIVNVIKTAATVGDYAAMAKDWRASSRLETLFVEATRAKLKLSPDPLVVPDDDGAKAVITASLEGLDASIPAQDVYIEWSCSGRNGYLIKVGGNNDVNNFVSTLLQASHNYFRSGSADPGVTDTIKATAYYLSPTTSTKVEIGWVTVPVQIRKAFTLAISPASGNVPVDTPLPVRGIVVEALPRGATVDWTWSHSGVGALTAQPPDNVPSDSAVIFDTGAGEGAATLTLRASIHIPAASGVPERTVVTDPVRATYQVKKGLQQVVLEVSAGVFGCNDTQACGVSEYTAYLVPRLPRARSYSAQLSGFGYPSCNRNANWVDGGTKGDHGNCDFPVTFHPHSSAGATNTYAVWIGFGGAVASGNRCVVTITLNP